MKKYVLMTVLVLALGLTGCAANSESTSPEAHEHAHGDFEWIGEYDFEAGSYLFHFEASEDETLDVGFIKMGSNITDLDHHASHLMVTDKEVVPVNSVFEAKPDFAYTFEMDPNSGQFHFVIEEAGTYAVVTEHFPHETNMKIFDEKENEIFPIKEHEGE